MCSTAQAGYEPKKPCRTKQVKCLAGSAGFGGVDVRQTPGITVDGHLVPGSVGAYYSDGRYRRPTNSGRPAVRVPAARQIFEFEY